MASIREHPNSGFWIACFTLPSGSRTQRSTKIPVGGIKPPDAAGFKKLVEDLVGAEITLWKEADGTSGIDARTAKRLAQRIADHFEDASRKARVGRLTDRQARRVISDIYSEVNKSELPNSTIRTFFLTWLATKEREATEKTHRRYKTVIDQVLAYLGTRGDRDITHLTATEIAGFRDELASRLTPGTVNVALKILRSALEQAHNGHLVDGNEAKRVSLLKAARTFERRPFTVDELKKVLKAANEEWRGMILCGVYTGLRLTDIATLTWAAVDLKRGELQLTTGKTGRRIVLPLARPLLGHLKTLPHSSDGPLFPESFAARERSQYGGTLSNRFYQILVTAGLAEPRPHTSQNKGRGSRRELGGLSFHCLRHTATSLLKNAGVSDAVARDIIGHESPAVSANYTHIDMDTKRKALAGLPNILKDSDRKSGKRAKK